MSRIRSTNTKPEIIVRSLLHRLGFRFRKNVKTLAGKPDIVLKKHQAIIFVHGCFWHQHEGCKRSNIPKSNQDYWKPKLEKNVLRDAEHEAELKNEGWKILTVWECEIKDLTSLENKIRNFLSE
jgi:DNA mismatch endonuclease (patch repair protein)